METKAFDMRSEELKVLNGLENWGTSLFLTAILLTSKQLVDWSIPVAPATKPTLTLQWHLFLLPTFFGFAAFIFLRAVNYRLRNVRREMFELVKDEKLVKGNPMSSSWGLVGWSMALMPLTLGLCSSWYFGVTRTELDKAVDSAIVVAGFMLGVAAVAFCWQSRKKN